MLRIGVREPQLHATDTGIEGRDAGQLRPDFGPGPVRAHDQVEARGNVARGGVVAGVEVDRPVFDTADVRVPADAVGGHRVEQDLAQRGTSDLGSAVGQALQVDVRFAGAVGEDKVFAGVAGVLLPLVEEVGVLEGFLAGGGMEI